MRDFILFFSVLVCASCMGDSTDFPYKLYGMYVSFSESDCDVRLSIEKNNEGNMSRSCYIEGDPSGRLHPTTIENFKWKYIEGNLQIFLPDTEVVFVYDDQMQCPVDESEKGAGLRLISGEFGYGENLWSVVGGCEL